jgi:hypothetical protein
MIKKTILFITLILLTSIVNVELSRFKKLGEAPAQQLGPKKTLFGISVDPFYEGSV